MRSAINLLHLRGAVVAILATTVCCPLPAADVTATVDTAHDSELYVLVPSLSACYHRIAVWRLPRLVPAAAGALARATNVADLYAALNDSGCPDVTLEPSLVAGMASNGVAIADRLLQLRAEAGLTSEPMVSAFVRSSPFHVWKATPVPVAVGAVPTNCMLDAFRRYLRAVAAVLGQNVCVDVPLTTQFDRSAAVLADRTGFVLRMLPAEHVAAAQKVALSRQLLSSPGRGESVGVRADNDLNTMWRGYLALLNELGIDVTLVSVDLATNTVIISGPPDLPRALDAALLWE